MYGCGLSIQIKISAPAIHKESRSQTCMAVASQFRSNYLHMEIKETHEQVGSIGYTVVDDTPVGKSVHLGYFTYPEFWGKGYTSEALGKVLEYAFTEDNVYRVTTGCLKENAGSERVMQKNGMIKEAEHVDYEWHDGRIKTRLEYRLLKKEWERGKEQ